MYGFLFFFKCFIKLIKFGIFVFFGNFYEKGVLLGFCFVMIVGIVLVFG